MNKPLPCNQKWNDMLPTDGGRICTGCGKLVVDFRKTSWADIQFTHLNNPTPTCGIYDEKQLNYWGQQIPSEKSGCSKLIHLSATLLALSQVFPTDIQAQTKATSTVVEQKQTTQINSTTSIPVKRIINGTVVKQLEDSTKRPVIWVSVIVCGKGWKKEVKTDVFGRFSIDITSEFSSIKPKFEITVSHPDYLVQSFTLDKYNLMPLDITLRVVTIVDKKTPLLDLRKSVSTMYAAPPVAETPKTDTIAKRVKKWWQRKRKN